MENAVTAIPNGTVFWRGKTDFLKNRKENIGIYHENAVQANVPKILRFCRLSVCIWNTASAISLWHVDDIWFICFGLFKIWQILIVCAFDMHAAISCFGWMCLKKKMLSSLCFFSKKCIFWIIWDWFRHIVWNAERCHWIRWKRRNFQCNCDGWLLVFDCPAKVSLSLIFARNWNVQRSWPNPFTISARYWDQLIPFKMIQCKCFVSIYRCTPSLRIQNWSRWNWVNQEAMLINFFALKYCNFWFFCIFLRLNLILDELKHKIDLLNTMKPKSLDDFAPLLQFNKDELKNVVCKRMINERDEVGQYGNRIYYLSRKLQVVFSFRSFLADGKDPCSNPSSFVTI